MYCLPQMSQLRDKLAHQRTAQAESWGYINQQRLDYVLQYAGPHVLDVGCANGIYVEELTKRGYRATGVDLLEYDQWQSSPNSMLVMDAAYLSFASNSFDTIISFETLEHVPDPQKALAEYYRVCRHNIILSVPNCQTPEPMRNAGLAYHHWVDRTHINFFTFETLRSALSSAGFNIQILTYINPVNPFYTSLRMMGFGHHIAFAGSKVLQKISQVNYHMTLLAVCAKG